jgi:hypothetical protein
MSIGDILIWEATNGLLLIPVVIGLVSSSLKLVTVSRSLLGPLDVIG